jgi:endonuclease
MLGKEEYIPLIRDAINRNETIVVSGYCTVRYSGRVEAFLEFGDRLITIKSDNVVMVHQPTGNAPCNYMKPETSVSVELREGNLFLNCKNIHKKEFLHVNMERVYFFNSHKLEDGQRIVVQGTEKHMSDMIYDTPEVLETGFKPVSREEQTKYGFIDVFGHDKNGLLTVVECKRTSADLGAVTQLRRYVERIMESKGISKVGGIIAAPKITTNAKKMLEDWGFRFCLVQPPQFLEQFDRNQTRLDGF